MASVTERYFTSAQLACLPKTLRLRAAPFQCGTDTSVCTAGIEACKHGGGRGVQGE
jgi:hypothetical protein